MLLCIHRVEKYIDEEELFDEAGDANPSTMIPIGRFLRRILVEQVLSHICEKETGSVVSLPPSLVGIPRHNAAAPPCANRPSNPEEP